MSEKVEPGYWAVIPAPVRYDTVISPNAKLLYAELSSLAKKKGFCYASNAYFSEVFKLTDTSVRRLIKSLSDSGYISVQVIRDEKTHEVLERRIYVGLDPCAQESAEGSAQKSAEGSAQKSSPINRYNKKGINNPPIVPHEIHLALEAYAAGDKELLEALDGFAEKRAADRNPINTKRSVTLLTNKLDKFSHGDRLVKIAMLDKAVEHNWSSVYALNDRDRQDIKRQVPPEPPPVREEDRWLR